MDIEGKGSLLLLLVSSLVLCRNVASHPTCLEGSKCHTILQDLHNNATYLTMRMHFNFLELYLEFLKQYNQGPFFLIPAIRVCHTAYISAPAGQEEARKLQHKDIIHVVIRYLLSWNDPLTFLAQEVHHLSKLHDAFKRKEEITFELFHQLKEVTKEIAIQLDPETTDNVDYAAWSGLHSVESPDEKSLLFTFYNMLRCLVTDTQKIETLLELLKCRVAPEDNCSASPTPVSETVSKDPSFIKSN